MGRFDLCDVDLRISHDDAAAIRSLTYAVHTLAQNKGWYDGQDRTNDAIGAKIALCHSELSEALECIRTGDTEPRVTESGKPEGLPSELADVVIRVLDLAGWLQIDLGDAIRAKHAYNATRPYRHGGKAL